MSRARIFNFGLAAVAAVLLAPLIAPQLLAFPYHGRSHGSEVWSEKPLPQPVLDQVLGRATTLVAQSPLADQRGETRRLFLTQGGWRWTWLTLQNRGAFGLTRGLNNAVTINRSNLEADRVWNGAVSGGVRSLSGVIAHEYCHGFQRRRFGIAVELTKPAWLREGYCDYVARESSLSDDDAARLKASGRNHPALPYWEGRRRVARELAGNGNNVDALFAAY